LGRSNVRNDPKVTHLNVSVSAYKQVADIRDYEVSTLNLNHANDFGI
jgi:hypothetical protein